MTVEALRRRRPETLGALLETYGRELQSVAFLILRDRAEAEDVVIETLLTAFEKAGSIRDDRALPAWLLRVATNHALGVRRRSGRTERARIKGIREGVQYSGRLLGITGEQTAGQATAVVIGNANGSVHAIVREDGSVADFDGTAWFAGWAADPAPCDLD